MKALRADAARSAFHLLQTRNLAYVGRCAAIVMVKLSLIEQELCSNEIPGAYKSIAQVIANQSDLVEVVATLKQVVCVKG